MSPAQKIAREKARIRMRENNPMRRPDVARRMGETRKAMHGARLSAMTKERRANGTFQPGPMTIEQRQRIAARMTANNPMKDASVIERVVATKRAMGQYEAASDRMKQTWADGKITSAHRRMVGGRRAINQSEAKLLAIVGPLGLKYTGDCSFWLTDTKSGKSRNPDFVSVTGQERIALLLHGAYWHRLRPEDTQAEMDDYSAKGWKVFVLWMEEKILKRHTETISAAVSGWLSGVRSNRSAMPDIHQFSI